MASQSVASFGKLVALQQTGPDSYESLTPAFWPVDTQALPRRAYGGHVYAQAVWATSRTVGSEYWVHNVMGHFLLGGRTDVPFRYVVRRVRDGFGYCLRSVEAYQESKLADDGKTPCFFGTVSFQRREIPGKFLKYSHQDVPRDHISKHYAVVLSGKRIEDHPPAPNFDAEWLPHSARNPNKFPGLDMRKVDMRAYNGQAVMGGGENGAIVSHWRQLTYYRLLEHEDGVEEEDSLKLCAAAHSYASDRNGLFMIQRALGFEHCESNIGSLTHHVIFHGDTDSINMLDSHGQPKWFVQEAWTSNSGENRICHNSRLWDVETGTVIATTMQEGMLRVRLDKVTKL